MVMLGGKLVAIRTEPEHHEHPPLPEHNPANIHQAVRHGCFFYVVLAALLLVTGGALLVWASQEYKKKHPPAPFQAAPEKL